MKIFDDVAQIDIQGSLTLKLLNRDHGLSIYQVAGFTEQIVVRDFRPNSSNPTLFADFSIEAINTPAKVTMYQVGDGSILIDLQDTHRKTQKYTLSIAGSINEFIPSYPTVFDMFTFLDDGSMAYMAVYKRSRQRQPKQDWSFLSV